MKARKILAALVAATMVLSMFVMPAFAAEAVAKIGETNYYTLADAITAAKEGDTIVLSDGTHTMPNSVANKNITIKGTSKENTIVEMLTAVGASGSTIAFDTLTAKFDNDNYEGLQHSVKITYKDCIHIGTEFLYAAEVAYTNCTFEMYDDATEYAVWTYGAKDVDFTNCVFNTNGKAILVYNESTTTDFVANIDLTKCTFNSNKTYNDKAAVELGQTPYGENAYNLTFTKCTANDFVENQKGTPTGSKLWGNKNSMNSGSGEGGSSVIIDNTANQMPEPDYIAEINGTKYESLQDAITAANAGDTITLLDNLNLTGWTSIDIRKAITLDGNGKTITGLAAPLVNNSSTDFEIKNLTVSGAGIEIKSAAGKDNDSSSAALVQWANGGTLTITNVTVKDSTIRGDGYVAAMVGFVDSPSAGVNVNGGAVENVTITAGGIAGTVSAATYADVNVSGIAVSKNTLTSTSDNGTRPDKVGLVVGRSISEGEVSVSANIDGTTNTAVPKGDNMNEHRIIGSLSSGGSAVVTGGSYPTDPTNIGNDDHSVAVAENFEVTQNSNGTYAVVEKVETPEATLNTRIYQIPYMEGEVPYVAVFAGIDSLDYDKVGFDATLNGTTKSFTTTTVYTSIRVDDKDAGTTTLTAKQFGDNCKYIFAFKIFAEGVDAGTTLLIKPFAITGDKKILGEECAVYLGAWPSVN